MGVAVLIIGRSGTGKSTSMRNMDPSSFGLINVLGKPMPFRGKVRYVATTDYDKVRATLKSAKANALVVDDAGYLITDMFMSRHANAGKGNGVFALYNDIGDSFYSLIRFIAQELPPERVVYLMMHEDTDELGRPKLKTIGKLLDEKVTLEGMVSIVLRSVCEDGHYRFVTNGDGITKSPDGMFVTQRIDTDLQIVDDAIRDYWGFAPLTDNKKNKAEKAGKEDANA